MYTSATKPQAFFTHLLPLKKKSAWFHRHLQALEKFCAHRSVWASSSTLCNSALHLPRQMGHQTNSNVYLSCKAFMCIVAVMSLKRFHIDSDCVETDYIGDGQSNDLK